MKPGPSRDEDTRREFLKRLRDRIESLATLADSACVFVRGTSDVLLIADVEQLRSVALSTFREVRKRLGEEVA